MKRAAIAVVLMMAASAAGLVCSDLLYRSPAAREIIARLFGRGELLAIVAGAGVYETDLAQDGDVAPLIVAANLRRASRDEAISAAAVEREFALLRHQFGSANVFDSELAHVGVTHDALRVRITEHLRGQQWLEKQIAPELQVREEDTHTFYDANTVRFVQPARFRVSHLFLAAPDGTPPEVLLAQQETSKALAKRLSKGENFAQLIAEASDDEATKPRGGDLGFFSAARMPTDFVEEVQKLQPGKPSAPIRLHLGFHILQLTDARPARQMSLAEVEGEIALHLVNAKRAAAVERLRERLMVAEFIRTPL